MPDTSSAGSSGAPLVVDIGGFHREKNEVAISFTQAGTVNETKWSGWTSVSAVLRSEGFPNDFEASITSIDPTTGVASMVQPGDGFTLYFGDDTIITGFVDTVTESMEPAGHSITVSGRGMTQDLVDCSAEYPGGSMQGSVPDIIRKLCEPYGIVVELASGIPEGKLIPQILLNYGEAAGDLIQHLAHSAGLMAYETPIGTLKLAQSGATTAASGVKCPGNVERYTVTGDSTERYSEIVCVRATQAIYGDVSDPTPGGNFDAGYDTETDVGVKRHRRLYMPYEAAADPEDFTKQKAKWEQARRIGRSVQVRATIDNWRDKAGTLWLPNTLVPVDVPGLILADKTLCVSEVHFTFGEDGTHAELSLMPPQAFAPEPFSLIQTNVAGIKPPSTTGAQ